MIIVFPRVLIFYYLYGMMALSPHFILHDSQILKVEDHINLGNLFIFSENYRQIYKNGTSLIDYLTCHLRESNFLTVFLHFVNNEISKF